MNISFALQHWYDLNKRDLPWRHTSSPYFIWLSEIILQQTRVNQGLQYYHKFVEKYPSIHDLANAPADEVMKLWQGLGYYTRARNMHETAICIALKHKGVFPGSFSELITLKGIGMYTASAVASLAFNEPVAVVDGNVNRVISRLWAVYEPVDSPKGKKAIAYHAVQMLDIENPGLHNQAIMELGALVCLPKNPRCPVCPLEHICMARTQGITDQLPVKREQRKTRTRYLNYIFIRYKSSTFIRKRNEKDIWHSLYELPMVETARRVKPGELMKLGEWKALMGDEIHNLQGDAFHTRRLLTHQVLQCSFYRLTVHEVPGKIRQSYLEVPVNELNQYPIPRVIENYLNDHGND